MVDREQKNLFERHAQTTLAMILVALLLWVGKTVQDTAVGVAELRVEVGFLKRAHEQPNIRLDDLEHRMTLLEQRMIKVEK